MSDQNKTKAELQQELAELRREVARLKAVEVEWVELKSRVAGPKSASESIHPPEFDQLVQELSRERDLLQALLDNVPDWIFFKDAQSRIIRSNKTHAQVLGLDDPQQAIGKTDFDFFPPEDAQRFYEEEQNFLQAGQPLIGRVGPTPGPDGEILWRSETKIPLKGDTGQVIGLVGISRDVTELKQAETALRQSEERYRVLFEDSPISLWEEDLGVIKAYIDELRQAGITDFRTYFDQQPEVVRHYANLARVVAVNPATLRLYQAADQEEFFNRMETVFREESLATFKEELIAIAAGQTHFEGESVHYTLTGSRIYVTLNWSVVPGYEQTYGKVVVSLIDITAYKETQARLVRQATDLETVAHVSTAMATILETDKLLQEVVDLTKERFGLYHAHLYLLDELGDELKLVAGAGEVGRQMVAEGWSIPIDQEQSLVARAARTGQGVISNDVRAAVDFLPNPLLPETRSEMAVPLLIGGLVSGVLDVQAIEVNRFSEEDSRIKTILAAQIAVALENADQHARTRLALAEMEQSQGILRSIIDATPDWIFIKDRKHRYQLVNQSYANSMHLTPEDMIGKNDLEIGFPEEIVKGDPEQGIRGFWADDTEVMDRGETKIIDVEPAVLDGKPAFLSTIKVPLRDSSGEVWSVLGYVRDITQREQLLVEVQESQKLLRTIIDATPDWIFIKDQEHRYRLVNEGYANSFHIAPENFIGKNDLEIGFPEEIVKGSPEKGIVGFWADDRAVMDSGQPKYIELEPAVVDDKPVWLSTRKIPLRDAPGRVWGVLGFVQDVTALEENRQTLAKRAAELETVAQVSTAAATVLQPGRLLQEVADLTKERFELYHAHIYLLNPDADRLYLTAGAGEVGRQMVAEGWSISLLREKSLVAQAARQRQGVIANDVQTEPDYLPNPLLPNTRSEMAVPMIVGDQVLGVLDVQADMIDRFTQEDIRVMTTLAAQVAVALQNARSYEQTQARAKHEQILRQITARVRGSTNPDAIVRTAVRELGVALDRPTFIRLGKTDQLRHPKAAGEAPLASAGSPGGSGRPEGDK